MYWQRSACSTIYILRMLRDGLNTATSGFEDMAIHLVKFTNPARSAVVKLRDGKAPTQLRDRDAFTSIGEPIPFEESLEEVAFARREGKDWTDMEQAMAHEAVYESARILHEIVAALWNIVDQNNLLKNRPRYAAQLSLIDEFTSETIGSYSVEKLEATIKNVEHSNKFLRTRAQHVKSNLDKIMNFEPFVSAARIVGDMEKTGT